LKYGVDNSLVEDFYIVVSSLGVLPQEIEADFGNLLYLAGPSKRKTRKLLMKSIIKQAIRGSFDIWINANENIRNIQHVENIVPYTSSLDETTDNNLFAFNKEMGYDYELMVSSSQKYIRVEGKLQAVNLLIDVKREKIGEVSQDEKKMLDFEDERSSAEVPKMSEEEKDEISEFYIATHHQLRK
jgi:hypothetical protein